MDDFGPEAGFMRTAQGRIRTLLDNVTPAAKVRRRNDNPSHVRLRDALLRALAKAEH
jgi:hypothetical protein